MKKDKNKLFTALGVFIGVIAISSFALWQFLFSGLSMAQDEYRTNRRALSEVEQKADLKSDLAKELEKISSDMETIQDLLLAEEDKLEFIQQIEDIALANGNTYAVKGTQEIKDPKTGELREIQFSANLQGSFNGIFGFLEDIRSVPYLIAVHQADIQKEEDGTIKSDVILKIYLQ